MPVHLLDTTESFREALKTHETVLIDWFAPWCGPCKVLAPFIEQYSNEEKYKNVFFAKIDVDTLSDLADELDVQAMPTLMMFKQGKKVNTALDPSRAALGTFVESSLE